MRLLFYSFLFLPVFCFGQAASKTVNRISIGTSEIIHSSILDEDREVWLYVPKSILAGSKTRYPVMYLLDGSDFFHSMTGITSYLSSVGKMPEMIVVGIISKDRGGDFTPTQSMFGRNGAVDADFKNSGRGEKFTSFIEKELMPHINSRFNTAPYRMFVGHSLGGLTVLNALVNHPTLFTSYVAIDPSVWWDNLLITKRAQKVLTQNEYANKSLYYAASNTMEQGMDTVRVIKDTVYANGNVRNHIQFREILRKSKNLQWAWKFYPEDNHSSVPLISHYDALLYTFKKYELGKDLQDTTITLEYIKDHYRTVSSMMNYTVLPSEGTVNLLGYISMGNKQYEKAYDFFKMNIDNYPDSPNAYDSMGDYYVESGNKNKAIEAFKKALTLQELIATRKKLEMLQAKN